MCIVYASEKIKNIYIFSYKSKKLKIKINKKSLYISNYPYVLMANR